MPATDGDKTLRGLRRDIERVDREIFQLVERRLALARRIGELKIEAGMPLRDFRVETEVLARAEALAAEIGFDPSLGRELVMALLHGSIKVQEDLRESRHRVGLKRVAVLGGRGKMGSWLCHFLRGQGHEVLVVDPAGALEGFPHAAALAGVPAGFDVYVLAVPMSAAPALYRELLTRDGGALFVDILSLKAPVVEIIREGVARGRRVASLHPLFGPAVVLLSGRVLVVCDCGSPAAAAAARELFAGTSLTVGETSLEEHDQLMALVLGLSHAVNVVFLHALQASGRSYADLRRFASTTFSRQVTAAGEVARENPDLYDEIQHLNPNTGPTFELLLRAAREVADAAGAARRGAFAEIMLAGRAWLEAAPRE